MTSTRAQIASAIRYANALFEQMPDEGDARERFGDLWVQLERDVTAAQSAGDIKTIEARIAQWRRAVAAEFEELTR